GKSAVYRNLFRLSDHLLQSFPDPIDVESYTLKSSSSKMGPGVPQAHSEEVSSGFCVPNGCPFSIDVRVKEQTVCSGRDVLRPFEKLSSCACKACKLHQEVQHYASIVSRTANYRHLPVESVGKGFHLIVNRESCGKLPDSA